jgi:predicted  nucleic acid-binding Zn-ribbon protein
MILSDETAPQGDLAAALAEIADLENQMKAIAAERDRYAFEKTEVVAKANSATRERDDLRIALAAAGADRDRHAAEKAEAVAKAQALAKERDELRDRIAALSAERDRLAAEKSSAEQAAAAAKAESARLRHEIETMPPPDPAKVLYDFAAGAANAAVAKVRSYIPPESPALGWFDKTVAAATEIGCVAVQATRALLRWAIPQMLKLYAYLKGEIEARIAKKQ